MGIIDWNGVVRALKEVGYQGFLSFELTGYKEPERYIAEAKNYKWEEILKQEDVWGKKMILSVSTWSAHPLLESGELSMEGFVEPNRKNGRAGNGGCGY